MAVVIKEKGEAVESLGRRAVPKVPLKITRSGRWRASKSKFSEQSIPLAPLRILTRELAFPVGRDN